MKPKKLTRAMLSAVLCATTVFSCQFLTVEAANEAVNQQTNDNRGKITNTNTGTEHLFGNNNYVECFSGDIITYQYVVDGKKIYRKLFFYKDNDQVKTKVFSRNNAKLTDTDVIAPNKENNDNDVAYTGNKNNKCIFLLQNILDLNKEEQGTLTINFYRGSYNASYYSYGIKGIFRVYSNTTICAPDNDVIMRRELNDTENKVVFINTDDEASKKLTGQYNGSGNITIKNLKFDLAAKYSEVGKFIHAKNINILNCEFFNGKYDCHIFELACIADSKVENCSFKNLLLKDTRTILTPDEYKGKKDSDVSNAYKEAIQIETAANTAFPYGYFTEKYRDETKSLSKNITVTGCVFNKVIRGVGNHWGESSKSDKDNHKSGENIKVTKNTFINFYDHAANIVGYTNFVFKENFFLINDSALDEADTSHQYWIKEQNSTAEIQNYVDVTSLSKLSGSEYQLWFVNYGNATSYDLYYFKDGTWAPFKYKSLIKNNNNTYKCIFTPVSGATKYRVLANKEIGIFTADNNPCEKEYALDEEIPYAPDSLAIAAKPNTIELSWKKDSNKECASNKNNHVIKIVRTDSRGNQITKEISADQTTYKDTNVRSGEKYTYSVTRMHKCAYKNYYSVTKSKSCTAK